MDITRNQYYMAGLILLFLGIQFRMIDRVEFTPTFTQFLMERSGHPLAAVTATAQTPVSPMVKPVPDWLGYLMLSVGSVLVLHSWGMPKPG